MTDLPDRILAAIEQAAHVAEKARDAGTRNVYGHTIQERWQSSGDGAYIHTEPDGVTILIGPSGAVDSRVANHVLRNQPSVILRRCGADKRTVERHRPSGVTVLVAGQERHFCAHCRVMLPCPDLLDRADAYGIEAS